jgi:phosphatidylglycerophosphate synthase
LTTAARPRPPRIRPFAALPLRRSPAAAEERRRARNYPLSRWYLRPLAGGLAAWLTDSRVRPLHLTLAGLAAGCGAALLMSMSPGGSLLAGCLALMAWFFDRADGQLARRQRTATPFGAWLDANVDELLDVAWHAAIALALASTTFSSWPWAALAAFLAGKYLFMYSLAAEEWQADGEGPRPSGQGPGPEASNGIPDWSRYRWLYHLPANADIRLHVLAFAVAAGLGGVQLLLFAAYYNVRWIVRYALVAQRLCGGAA